MSNTNDFIIENGSLIKYVGSGGDVVIPEGVTSMSILAFQQIPIVSLTLPDSFENVPSLSFSDEQLKNIFVTEGNKWHTCQFDLSTFEPYTIKEE